jgi:large subunit ribosomal protein L41
MLRSALLAFTRGRKVPRTGYTVLTPKRGPRDYYKGKGAQPTGKHTRKGVPLS